MATEQPDKIVISSMDCVASIGVSAEERTIRQRLSIDLEFPLNCRIPAETDSLKDTIDYAQIAKTVSRICGSREFHLIETVAEMVARQVLEDFPIPSVRVLIRKISPVVEPRVAYVSVEITRP